MSRASVARAALRFQLQALHRDINKTMAETGETPIPLAHVALAFNPDGTSNLHVDLSAGTIAVRGQAETIAWDRSSDSKASRLAATLALSKLDPVAGEAVRLALGRRFGEADKLLAFHDAAFEVRKQAARIVDEWRSHPRSRGRPSPPVEPHADDLHFAYAAFTRWGYSHAQAVYETWRATTKSTGLSERVTGRRIAGYRKIVPRLNQQAHQHLS